MVTILVRSIFRLIELQEGFDGELANNELDFMILEGPMIFIGVAVLTIWHPGYVLGAKLWVDAGFNLRRVKQLPVDSEVDTSSYDNLMMQEREPRQMV